MDKAKFAERFIKLLNEPQFIPTDPNLKAIKEKKGNLGVADLAKYLKCSGQALRNWTSGTSLPTLMNIESIANLFDVSEGWLLGYIDTAKTEEINDYEPFRQMGFTPEAWESLRDLRDYFYKTTPNPQYAEKLLFSTLKGINVILEMIDKNKKFLSPYRTRNLPKNHFSLPVLGALTHFFNVEKPTFQYDIEEYIDIDGFIEENPSLTEENIKVIQDFYNDIIENQSQSIINPVEDDLIALSKATEQLKQFKLLKIEAELEKLVFSVTNDKNRDFREGLTTEETNELDKYTKKKYHYLYSLFMYYSIDR